MRDRLQPLPRTSALRDQVYASLRESIRLGRIRPGDRLQEISLSEALGVSRTRTSTAWTSGKQDFEGVSLKVLLERVGAFGDRIEAIALNDYKVEIPVSDFSRWPVILAYRANGALLRVRDKGPLWIVYPQDDFPALDKIGRAHV